MSSPIPTPPLWLQYVENRMLHADRQAYARRQERDGVDPAQAWIDATNMHPGAHPMAPMKLPSLDPTDTDARDRALIAKCSVRTNPFNHE